MDNFEYRPLNKVTNKKGLVEKFTIFLQDLIDKIASFFSGKKDRFGKPTNKGFRTPNGKPDWKRIIKIIALGVIGVIAAGIITFTLLIIVLSFGLPSVHDLDKLSVAQSTTIYDREGNVLYVRHGDENRQYVPYEQISSNIINATIAIEDDQFWQHSGFDLVGITRAALGQVTGNDKGGGSTITQQYIKNTFLTPERSYIRKIKELILSVQLEQAYDKKKILELYLNKIPYGNNAFGVEKASQIYFDKHASDLTLPEATILAALPQAQSHYNPYGQYRYSILTKTIEPDEVKARNIKSESDLRDTEFIRGLIGKEYELDGTHSVYIQGRTDLVLKTMVKLGYITEQQREEALAELQTMEFQKYVESIKAPHFVFYILDELEKKYGKEVVEQGGLQVYTSLDPNLQEIAETAIEEGVDRNTEKYNAKNGALTAIDPKTGQILAMVGSRDYFDEEIDGAVNIATSFKQPGSSFKPFVYAKAFYNRYAPGSIVFDVETRFGASAYPKNYDGTFMGPISLRKALGQSRNIPAIKAYYLAGEQGEIIPFVEKMGIELLEPDKDYGYPLAIGTGEVKQLDLVSAFGVFANNGIRKEPTAIIKIQNARGEILEEWKDSDGEEVVDPQVAYLINDILSDDSVKIGEYEMVSGHAVAAKTGTSNRKLPGNIYLPHDLWTIGYTSEIAVAVWTGNTKDGEGNNIGSSASGYTASAPILHEFLQGALADRPTAAFEVPDGIIHETISKLTGKLPGPNTPEDQLITEVFASFSVPTEIDDSYTEAKIDTRNEMLANEYCPEQFVENKNFLVMHDIAPYETWEEGAQKWLSENMGTEVDGTILGIPPIVESELCTKDREEEKPEIKIRDPKKNDQIPVGSNLRVNVKVNAKNGVEKIEYYLDGQFKYSEDEAPYTGIIRLPKGVGKAKYELKAVAYDKYGYTGEDTINIVTVNEEDSSTDTTSDSTSDTPPSDSSSTPSDEPPSDEPPATEPVIPPSEPLDSDLPPPAESTI